MYDSRKKENQKRGVWISYGKPLFFYTLYRYNIIAEHNNNNMLPYNFVSLLLSHTTLGHAHALRLYLDVVVLLLAQVLYNIMMATRILMAHLYKYYHSVCQFLRRFLGFLCSNGTTVKHSGQCFTYYSFFVQHKENYRT